MSTLGHLGQRIAVARAERGLTQEGLAGLANVAAGTVRSMERGQKVRPSNLSKVMDVLGLEPEADNAWRTGLPPDVELAVEIIGMMLLDMPEQDRPLAVRRAIRALNDVEPKSLPTVVAVAE